VTLPLLSVVIPTRNRAQMVCEAIDSALGQSEGQVEVIVVDDASTDNTASVLTERYGTRIRLLRHSERRGAGASRNDGLRVARGHLLAFLDDDDLWLPGKLDAELSVFERFPEAEVVISDGLTFVQGEAAAPTFLTRNGLLAATQGQPRLASECGWLWTNSVNGVAMCSITLRRSVLDRIGETWFPEDLTTCEDWEFEMRVYHRSTVVALPHVFSWVRRVDDGVRIGRAAPGKPPTREEQMGVLSDRLKVMERSHWLTGLSGDLAAELERFRNETRQQLAQLAVEA
jgi:glycosyltransferase involved in cell wall biosynthesis